MVEQEDNWVFGDLAEHNWEIYDLDKNERKTLLSFPSIQTPDAVF